MRTEDIATLSDLKGRVYGKHTGEICHYTSYESLIMILKNQSLRLTRYDLMNDIAERTLSKCAEGDSRYIISFTGTNDESVAMWALYGKHSSIKLRLDFSRGDLIRSVYNNFYYDSKKREKISTSSVPGDYSKRRFTMSDVVYYDRNKNRIRLCGKSLKDLDVTNETISELAGTIKYSAWEYEKEARLAVLLHRNSQQRNFNEITHIYAGLTDEFIDRLTITYSPWIDDELFHHLRTSINSMIGRNIQHRRSSLQGEIGVL